MNYIQCHIGSMLTIIVATYHETAYADPQLYEGLFRDNVMRAEEGHGVKLLGTKVN